METKVSPSSRYRRGPGMSYFVVLVLVAGHLPVRVGLVNANLELIIASHAATPRCCFLLT
jgi:hypothetical protein